MAAISKFYFHAAANTLSGTLLNTGSTVSATNPTAAGTKYVTANMGLSMNEEIGILQTSSTFNTDASTASQSTVMARFYSRPIAAQTIGSQTITVQIGQAEANLNSNFQFTWSLAVWRPSTGSLVGRIWDKVSLATEATAAGTQENVSLGTGGTSTSVTSQDQDVLVLEIWRGNVAQGMATAYSNTIYYDGTTEGSTTTNAAYLNFTTPIQMHNNYGWGVALN